MSDAPRTVLVADDDEDILQLVSFRLERAGYTVVTAADGQQALAAARQHQPDLAVLDVMMPGPDGLTLCRSLRQRGEYAIPVILLTALATKSGLCPWTPLEVRSEAM